MQLGGCDGCAVELEALRSGAFDLDRHRFRFVSAPHEAELLLLTGSLKRGVIPWLTAFWMQMPAPKGIAAIGRCVTGNGPFREGYALSGNGASPEGTSDPVAAVTGLPRYDMILTGCPPTPGQILNGLWQLASGQIVHG